MNSRAKSTNIKMIKAAQPSVDIEEVDAAKEVILSGQYVSGAKVSRFEQEFAWNPSGEKLILD